MFHSRMVYVSRYCSHFVEMQETTNNVNIICICYKRASMAVMSLYRVWCYSWCYSTLCADNASARQIASNPGFHESTKQIEFGCHFIRHVMYEDISRPHLFQTSKPADLYTKSYTNHFMISSSTNCCFIPPHISFEGECRDRYANVENRC